MAKPSMLIFTTDKVRPVDQFQDGDIVTMFNSSYIRKRNAQRIVWKNRVLLWPIYEAICRNPVATMMRWVFSDVNLNLLWAAIENKTDEREANHSEYIYGDDVVREFHKDAKA